MEGHGAPRALLEPAVSADVIAVAVRVDDEPHVVGGQPQLGEDPRRDGPADVARVHHRGRAAEGDDLVAVQVAPLGEDEVVEDPVESHGRASSSRDDAVKGEAPPPFPVAGLPVSVPCPVAGGDAACGLGD